MNNLIEQVRKKFGILVINQLEEFFGDEKSQINKALDFNLPIIIRIISHYSNNKSSIVNLMNLINEGGHASDLFDELELVFSDYDKMQLLGTIGSNLNKNFYKDLPQILNLTVQNSNLKKSSANSLLNFLSPIVLSVIGKNIKNFNWNIDQLKNYLHDQIIQTEPLLSDEVKRELSLSEKKVVKENEESEDFTNEILEIRPLAWVLILIFLGLSIWYYVYKNENFDEDEQILNSISSKEKIENENKIEEKIIGFENDENRDSNN